MMISAVLDACVLYPATLRNFLLWLASSNAFFPLWSEEIRNEWIGSLLRNHPDLKPGNLEQTRRKMNIHFPTSLIRGYESITPTLQLPDPKDQHVLAAAIHANAKYIVTFNMTDFPNAVLQSYNIEALLPDEFVWRLIQEAPDFVLQAVKNHRMGLTRPFLSTTEYLAMLEKQRLPRTVAFLREYKGSL